MPPRRAGRIAFLVLLAGLFAARAHAAPFVTAAAVPGQVTSIVAAGEKIYVARENFPSILVYDPVTSTLEYEVSLLLAARDSVPAGVSHLVVTPQGTVIAAAQPYGEFFHIANGFVTSLRTLPKGFHSETISQVTALHVDTSGVLYIGARSDIDTLPSYFFRAPSYTYPSGAQRYSLEGDSIISSIASLGRTVVITTRDTRTPHGGRIYIYDTPTNTVRFFFGADSEATASVARGDTILYAFSPSGRIGRPDSTFVVTLPDTRVNAMHLAHDGAETVVFFASETHVLRALTSGNVVRTYGVVNAALERILGLATIGAPRRVYGIGRGPGGSSLFYYDTTAPWVESVDFGIDSALRPPGSGDTLSPPVTWGRYTLRIHTNEKLAAVPQITLVYPDGAMQTINMSGTNRDFSGVVLIDSYRAPGSVTINFVGVDDAGNTGTVFIAGRTFQLLSLGVAAIANNRFRPGLGELMTVRYLLLSRQNVSVKVYNMRGQMVVDLSPGWKDAGQHQDITWNGRNSRGELCGSGVYWLRMEAGGEIRMTQKVMLIR